MTMRLKLLHRSGYRYESTVVGSYNEARMTPLSDANQTTFAATLKVQPNPWQITYRDYWGATVTAFEIHQPHAELAVTAECTVETHVQTPDQDVLNGMTWADLEATRGSKNPEFLEISALTEPGEELRALAAQIARTNDPHRAALLVCNLVHDEVAYVTGSTSVHSRAIEAWDAREGVCQDMAHLSVGALRSMGIPARYVSGYLHPAEDPQIGAMITGESHAWVEWWAGTWTGFDPTNAVPYCDRHVVVARGRDYRDVAPLNGIYAGGETAAMYVDVEVTRTA